MALQEVVLGLRARGQKQNGALALKFWRTYIHTYNFICFSRLQKKAAYADVDLLKTYLKYLQIFTNIYKYLRLLLERLIESSEEQINSASCDTSEILQWW